MVFLDELFYGISFLLLHDGMLCSKKRCILDKCLEAEEHIVSDPSLSGLESILRFRLWLLLHVPCDK